VALILVVDDESGVRSHVCQVLEDAGYRLELSLQIQPSYPRLSVLFISKYPDDLPLEGVSHWPVRYAILPKSYTVPKLLRSVRGLLSTSPNPLA
jgi:hypothetical protein